MSLKDNPKVVITMALIVSGVLDEMSYLSNEIFAPWKVFLMGRFFKKISSDTALKSPPLHLFVKSQKNYLV